ncbi:cyanophycinase [Arsukibacterium tuosuense]|uniref:Cyanophycinase n=1 Tax=Arsukibacterium tuosuense TaxID=1323745 RepID=A0A285I4Y3_9GAMM|nr:cyanophycinase [Arsukibacterium tuosuense]SNY42897.1 cyanophycinase [Arsukibacterium tuosuense]
MKHSVKHTFKHKIRHKFISIPVSVISLSLLFGCTEAEISEPKPAVDKGALVLVGGALAGSNAEVYQHFIELAGGELQARIAVIPAASGQPVKYFKQFQEDMQRYGLDEDQMTLFPVAVADDKSTKDVDESQWRRGATDSKLAEQLSQFTAVWFLGGDQLNITATLAPDGQKSVLLEAIWALYQRGGVVGGTSAGAAMMSDVMIAAGDSWGALTEGTTESYNGMQDQENGPLMLAQGLGFFPHAIIDQHFDRKARFGRLIVAAELNKATFPMGFGIDENTALVYTAYNNSAQVIGAGAVTAIDVSNARRLDNPHGYHIENVRVSVMQGGDHYHFDTEQFVANPLKSATVGHEYLNLAKPVVSGVFSRNSRLKDMLTFDLVDNKGTKEVVSYLHQGQGLGFTLRFSQDDYTTGYWQYLDGLLDSGSAFGVKLDIVPTQFSIKPLTATTAVADKETADNN